MQKKITYFEKTGKGNTDATLQIVRERAKELKIDQVVIATTHGYTAQRAKAILGPGIRIIAVSISAGFEAEGWAMSELERKALSEQGITVVTCSHALGDTVDEVFGGTAPGQVIRETLYRFCQGMKVAVEVSLMAADAGQLDVSKEAISVAGTGEGADTAIVLKPSYARKFKDLQIKEILAKPR